MEVLSPEGFKMRVFFAVVRSEVSFAVFLGQRADSCCCKHVGAQKKLNEVMTAHLIEENATSTLF